MLSENIKNLRKQKGYSQETLAQELNVVRQTVSKWEKGYSVPDALMIEKMAELFEVTAGELLGETEKKLSEPKPDLAQISAQLSILNDQYARELARKEKIRKIKAIIFIPCLAVFLLSVVGIYCALFVSCPGDSYLDYFGDISTAVTREVASDMYSQADIASATDAAMEYFHNEFEGCKLTEIYYGGDDLSSLEGESLGGEAIVLLSSFETDSAGGDGSFNSDYTYTGWKWIMAKDTDGSWYVAGYGYA